MRWNHTAVPISFRGRTYTARRLGRAYQLSPSTIKFRYRHGVRGDDLVAPPRDSTSHTIVDGHVRTLRGLAAQYHLNLNTLKGRYRAGRRGNSLIRRPAMLHVDFHGQRWTLHDLGRRYHLNPSTIYSRYQRGDQQDALVRPAAAHRASGPQKETKHRQIVLDGKHYSYHSLSQASGISSFTIRSRYRNGYRGHDLLHTPRPVTHPVRDPRTHERTTFKKLAQKYRLNYGTLRNRYRSGLRGERLLHPTKNVLNHVRVRGQRYTFRELSQEYDISLNTILDRYYQMQLRGDDLIRPVRWTTHR